MSYVLVALHDGMDEATKLTLELAEFIAKNESPQSFFKEAHPSHEEVRCSVQNVVSEQFASLGTGLIFGHCGRKETTLRPQQARTPHWATAQEFAGMFQQTRVYVFACETIPHRDEENESTPHAFGELAVREGVRLFVGHYISVGVPEAPPHWTLEQKDILQQATGSVFFAFLRGENDERALKKVVLDAVTDFEVAELPDDINDGETATGWGAALLLHKLRESLVVMDGSDSSAGND